MVFIFTALSHYDKQMPCYECNSQIYAISFNHYCNPFSHFEILDVNLIGSNDPEIVFIIILFEIVLPFSYFGTPISKQYGPFSNCCGNNHYHLCKDLFMALKVSTSGQPTSRAWTQYSTMHVRTERQNLWYDVLTENSRRAAATTTTDESIGKVTARVPSNAVSKIQSWRTLFFDYQCLFV